MVALDKGPRALLEHQEFQSEDDPPDGIHKTAALQSTDLGHTLPSANALPQTSPTTTPHSPSSQKRRGRLENLKLGIEFAGLAALIVYTVFSVLQWAQIRWTNRLTKEALEDSDKTLQATLTKLQGQIDATNTLAGYAKIQADKAAVMAINSGTQAIATTHASEAARRAADIADKTLHISERAYLTLGTPIDDFAHKRMSVPLINSGHIPSGRVTAIVHEATFVNPHPGTLAIPVNYVVERHWTTSTFPNTPVGSPYVIEVGFPALVVNDLNSGKQDIFVVISIRYNDGFPDTPDQTWSICDRSTFSSTTNVFTMRPCMEDFDSISSGIIRLDEYPNEKYQQKNQN